MLEQILIAKVFNFGGICSGSPFMRHSIEKAREVMIRA
jgi:hypothetical protein